MNNNTNKRKHQDENIELEDDNDDIYKSAKLSHSDIVELVNQVENDEFEELNSNSLKKLVLSFENKYLKNQQLRSKFKDDHSKYLESEMDLDESIKNLQVLATTPDLYSVFVQLGTVVSLGSLLTHPNIFIVASVIDLLYELLQHQEEESDQKMSLYQSMIENGIVEALVQTLSKLEVTEEDELKAIVNVYNCVETLLDLNSEQVARVLTTCQYPFISYLVSIVTSQESELKMKLHASELLSIILQSNQVSHDLFGTKLEGIEKVLVVLSKTIKTPPVALEEKEFYENLIQSLCSVLLTNNTNKQLFIKSEGTQLMLLFIKKKTIFRGSALKLLNFSISNHKDSNENFVQVLGLKTLFTCFMKKLKKSSEKKKIYSEFQDDEHIITIIFSLLTQLNKDSDSMNRLLFKFTENDFEKLVRLLELHEKYYIRVQMLDRKIQHEQQQKDEEEDDEDLIYLKRLEGGLFTLQYIDLIMLLLSYINTQIKQKLLDLFKSKNFKISSIKAVISDYLENNSSSITTYDISQLLEKTF
ncbi:armadillo-like helical domain-containing protein [Tieghemostelium lacteum]|uniref:Armadillo-like helical domain-containing protein n=1 Tax=Tieghemostelium lacteum TaxID=361077 RepID=A0A152A396_TIELA|nr:armadillo-like helical domain-containing protein [Tieghemostelium lacteum]|eukprot:KYR00733.1 armadillo-like helical domain-containing protein [Tieghemostelium lacteum]